MRAVVQSFFLPTPTGKGALESQAVRVTNASSNLFIFSPFIHTHTHLMGMCCFSLSFLDSFMTGLWREKLHLQSILYHPFHVSVERMTLRSHCLCATVVASFELVEAGLQAFSDPLPVFLLAFYLLHSGETHALSWIRGRRVPSGSTPPFSNHLNHYSSVSVDHFRELVFFFFAFSFIPLNSGGIFKRLTYFRR